MPEKIPLHNHTGTESPKIDLKDIANYIQAVTSVPTHIPKVFYEAIKLYVSGGTYRLYIYDFTNGEWRYVTLT
jgi:hypothetical protein